MRTISLVLEFHGLHYLKLDADAPYDLFQQEYKVEVHAAGPGLTGQTMPDCLTALRKQYAPVIRNEFEGRMFVGAGDVAALAYYSVYKPGSGLVLLGDALSPMAVGHLLLTHVASHSLADHGMFAFQVLVRRSDRVPEVARLPVAACWATYERLAQTRLTHPERAAMLAPWTKEVPAQDNSLDARRRRFNGGSKR